MTPQHMPSAPSPHAAAPDAQVHEVLRLFDAKAAGWAAKYAPDGPLAGRLADLSAAVRGYAQAGSRVLDLGCGTGELARALAADGLRVTGCDISPQMLARAARDGDGCSWVRLDPDWTALPFASAAFDVVVASSVLEYTADPVAVLRECARVLRPGGVLLGTVPDLRHPVRWAEWCAQRLAAVTGEPSGNSGHSQWQRYRAYLGASRQRHRIRWWRAACWSVGLDQAPVPDVTRSALRLLAFRRGQETGGSLGRQAGQ